jgi:hypothetical protein
MFPVSNPMANIRLIKTSAHSIKGTKMDAPIRCIRRRERNGSGGFRQLKVRRCFPFGEITVKWLPYLDLLRRSKVRLKTLHTSKSPLNCFIPGCGGEDLPVRCPCPIPDDPSV